MDIEAIAGGKTIQEISAKHAIHPILMIQWKRKLLDGASELFTRAKETHVTGESQAQVIEYNSNATQELASYERLQMSLE